MSLMNHLASGGIILSVIVILGILFFGFLGIRVIPNNKIGIIEKKWSSKGSIKNGFIALNGEAGYSPDLLRGGIHWMMPFQYKIIKQQLVSIPQGKIGYVFARDGKQLESTKTLAGGSFDFQDARAFLANGGIKGPQIRILREGTYAINTALFIIFTDEKTYGINLSDTNALEVSKMADIIKERNGFKPVFISGSDDQIGVVTVHDGPGLTHGEIIAPIVGEDPASSNYHNNFQDPEKFLLCGGRRGRQLQVLIDGTYYINRLFATIELIPKTTIEVGTVGVVISYTGESGDDVSGDAYTHGELVKKGERGVWSEAMLPGKYAFNTYAGKIVAVPTTNFILKWEETEVGNHKYDENLAEVALITKDAFEPWLPLSVVVHIDYKKAPLVVQRFGDIKKLVEQTLDPMVSAYFKNVAQTRTLIQLIQARSEIQNQASTEMKEKFQRYNLDLEEVLIGTPSTDDSNTSTDSDKQIKTILSQLRSRQIAEEQVETYERQQKAAEKERSLREAESISAAQKQLTESQISIQMLENKGKAEYQQSLQQANQVRAMAEAEADKIRSIASADATRIAQIGIAQALAIEEQVKAYGGSKFQLTQQVMNRFSEAIEHSKVEVVPRIVVGGQNGQNNSVLETLMTMLMGDKLDGLVTNGSAASSSPDVEALRKKLKDITQPKALQEKTNGVVS